MAITYNELGEQAYVDQLFNFIVAHEADKRDPYLDTHEDTFVTIGYGFNIEGNPAIRTEVYKELGFRAFIEDEDQFSEEVQAREQYYIDQMNAVLNAGGTNAATITTLHNLMAQRAADPIYEDSGVDLSKTSFSFSGGQAGLDEMRRVFNTARTTFETQVDSLVAGVPPSTERIALFSMAYNDLLDQSPSFLQAMADGNRARAYYELRFNSNPGRILGVHNRRIAESNFFGLYNDPGEMTADELDEESKNVVRFMEQYRDYVTNTYLPSIVRLMNDGTTEPAPQPATYFTDPLSLAINYLIVNYGLGSDIQNIIVGDNPNTDAAVNDDQDGAGENDLIFGEDGSDTINGGGGNDVLYGGIGQDTLEGGAGNDQLIGADRSDDLTDTERDTLRGGDGFDTYYAAGNDIIDDSDGVGEVRFGDDILVGGKQTIDGDNSYYGLDGTVYVLNDTTLTVRSNAGTITIQNYNRDENSLGIELVDRDDNDPPPPPRPRGGDDPQPMSPIALDLNGDGLQTTALQNGVYFDLNTDGLAEKIAYLNPNDGFLALDRNGDGLITNGSELFGNNTPMLNGSIAANGYEALRSYDSNGDSLIDSNDAIYADLRIWRDTNMDGISRESELYTLSELGVSAIGVSYTNSTLTDNGNELRQLGLYRTADGELRQTADIWFQTDPGDQRENKLPLTPEIMALPDTAAFGRAPSLRQAILADTSGELRTLVESLIQPGLDHNQRVTQIEQMLFKMTGQQEEFGLNPENSLLLDVRIIGTLEAYYNQRLQDAMYTAGTGYLNWYSLRFEQLLNSTFYQLASQTFLSQYFDVMTFNYDADRNLVGTDFHQAITDVLNDAAANPVGANDLIFDFVRAVRGINPYEEQVFDDFQADFAEVVAGGSFAPELTAVFENALETFPNVLGFASTIETTDANDVLLGTFGNDNVRTFGGDDEIQGGRGIDAIDAGAGDDVLDGGMDRDTLTGGAGSDVYVWGRSYGQDEIIQTGGTAGDVDVVQFTADLIPADLRVWRWGGDLVIGINGTSDTLSIKDWFSPNNRIASLEFSDGTVWTPAQVEAFANTATEYNDYLTGTAGDDIIQGLAGDDIIVGNAGNDSLSGGAGNDQLYGDARDDSLYGEAGNDRLYGGVGADSLDGGAGNDALDGGAGNDTYRFGRGSGSDSIENRYDNADFDTIEMAADVLPSDILVSRQNNDLVLTISGTEDVLTIRNWYYSPDYRVDQVVFNNGTIWDIAQLEAFINQATAGDDIITGTASADVLDGLAGNDTVSGLDGDDELHGNTGNDTLRGGTGDDLLLGEAGNDALHGDAGDDTLEGGAGNDQLYGGSGNDTYQFGRGSGNDQISEPSGSAAETDTILMANDVLPDDIRVQRISSGLRLVIRDTGDTLSINGWYNGSGYQIQQVVFGDGTVWTSAQLETMAAVISEEDDYVFGDVADNTLNGLGGNDYLYGAEGNDTLSGGTGNDYIQGDAGNDNLLGEAGNDTLYGSAGNDSLDGGDGDDQLRGEAGQDTLLGGAGNDTLYAGTDNDVLEGGSGDDTLYGEQGADTLTGGAGNDRLEGGRGNDTYYFGPGDGQDRIYDWDNTAGNIDTVRITGVTPAEVNVLRQSMWNMVLLIPGTGDQLTVEGGFSTETRIERVEFDDGTIWDFAQLEALAAVATESNDVLWATEGVPLHGLGGNDSLFAHVTGSELYGDAGNDGLSGNSGSDSLYGADGDDTLFGFAGDDVLDGGAGNDRLEGGTGNDNYRFGVGYGQDTIVDTDNTAFNQDSVILDEELTPADVRIRFVNNQLTLFIEGSDDRLTLGGGIERVVFDDGTIWTQSDLYAQARTGSAENDELQGSSGNDMLDGLAGDDRIYGQDGDDTLSGGTGNDYIRGDAGNDSLDGQEGDDELYGAFGNDALAGGAGNDRLYGYEGNDQLTGGDGADSLYGEGGDDELDGGAGNDLLDGGSGNDIYWLGRGSGQDVIQEYYGGSDAIHMAADVTPGDIDVALVGYTLVLRIIDTGDSISVQNWVNNPQTRVEQVVFADGTIWDSAQLESLAIQGTEGDDNIWGTNNDESINALGGNDIVRAGSGNDTVNGGTGNDSLFGESGNDVLSGGEGSDTLHAGEGADELDGGAGNDTLNGYLGSDVYHFSRGGGNDQISEGWSQSGDTDTVLMANDILPSDVMVQRVNGNNLQLSLTDGQGTLTITGWYLNTANQIEQVVFGDGTVWSAAQLEAMAYTPTEGNDTLYGTSGDDTLDALAGNDAIWGGDGNDTLTGGAGNDSLYGESGNDALQGGSGDDLLSGGSGNDLLEGGDGFDQLYGGDGNDVLVGSGNDTLNGDAGDDSLTGGTGANTLRGGEGSDTYHFGLGSGSDLIVEQDNAGSAIDTLQMGAGIAPQDIRVTRDAISLTLSILNTSDAITIHNWYGSENNRVEQVVFENGTVWSVEDLETLASTGTDGNDVLYGTEGNDSINGLAGNDTVYANAGNDVLVGGEGNDILHGEAGDDDLSGGAGDDTLYGGTGNDVYHYGRNEGFDSIVENDSTSGNTDRIQFGADILPGDVLVARSGNDLVISTYGDAGSLRIGSWFTGSQYQVEEARFADGTVWTAVELEGRVGLLTEHDDSYVGNEGANTINGLGGDDTLIGNGGDDVLEGGEGNDELFGGNDSDILTGGAGEDDLQGGQGDDTYRFSSGDGQDTLLDKTGTNTIEYDAGIAPADIVISRDGSHLYLNNSVAGDRLMVQQWFTGTPYQGVQVIFADGTVWDQSEVMAMIPATTGTQYDDYIVGPDSDASLAGLAGDDQLLGGSGDDTLDGGVGTDFLSGGSGSDTYLFGYGDGEDVLDDNGEAADIDVIQLGAGIGTGDITLTRDSSSLYISLNGTADRLTVNGWANEPAYSIEQIQFAEGTVWDKAEIENHITVPPGTESDDEIFGTTGADIISALDGNDSIYADAGDDLLDGGSGDDSLIGGTGSDTYIVGPGDGWDYIEEWDPTPGNVDIVQFEAGISPDDLAITRDEEELLVEINGESGLFINQWFEDEAYQIERFEFADGTIWDVADIESQIEVPLGTEDDEEIYGRSGADLVFGAGGDDWLVGYLGDDVLIGGSGYDEYQGGKGGDVYAFNPGDIATGDMEYIEDHSGEFSDSESIDSISLGGGLQPSDIYAYLEAGSEEWSGGEASWSTLYLQLGANGGTVRIDWLSLYSDQGYEENYDNRIERLQFIGLNDHQIFDLIGLVEARHDELVEAWENETFIPLFTPETLTEFDITAAEELAGGDHAVNYALTGDPALNLVSGSSGDDMLTGTLGNDKIEGLAGNDTQYGLTGDDVYIFGVGAGEDTIEDYDTGANTDTIRLEGVLPWDVVMSKYSNDPDDLLITFNTFDYLVVKNYFQTGSEDYRIERIEFDNGMVWDSDFIFSGTDPDTIDVGDGNDVVYSGGGNDVVYGGTGNDFLYGQTASDTLYGGDGDDYLHGGRANDILYGGSGNDILQGLQGVDELYGESGDDIFIYHGDDDSILDGGDGVDLISFVHAYANGIDGVTAVLQESATNSFDVTIGSGSPISYSNAVSIEGFIGSDYNDSLSGNSGDNAIYGGDGSDSMTGNAGSDLLDGGAGSDYVDYTESSSAIAVDLAGGTASGGHAEGDILRNIENILGSAWDDAITGDDGANHLIGGSGNDVLTGSGGVDDLYAGNGDDTLFGGDGNDALYGEAGSDQLVGGAGNDGLIGGAGGDYYYFGTGDDQDIITEDLGGVDAGAIDIVGFTPDITIDELWFTQEGDHLRIWVDGADDWLQIDNWYSNSAPGIEQFVTTEYLLLAGQVQQLVDAMAVFDPPGSGVMNIPQEARDEVAPVIAASWTYQGGPI